MSGTGAIAQLGERLLCKQEVVGSIPSGSTKLGLVPPGVFVCLVGPGAHALRADGLALPGTQRPLKARIRASTAPAERVRVI